MSRRRFWFLPIFLLIVSLAPLTPAVRINRQSQTIVVLHVNLLTMRDDNILRDQTVVVQDGLITAVGPAATTRYPKPATRVDGRGKYLMPGLADMHVHPQTADDLISFLAYGVTAIANLRGAPHFLQWQKELKEGKIVGPNLYTTGPTIDDRPLNRMFAVARTPEQGKAIVADQKRSGYNWIKVYSTLTPEVYHAILDAAKENQIAVIGHLPWFIHDAAELKRGQAMVAHAEEFMSTLFEGVKPEKIAAITQAVRESGITVTPNLVAYSEMLKTVRDLDRVMNDPESQFFSPANWSEWLPANNRYSNRDRKTFEPRVVDTHAFMGRFIKAFHEAGVPLLLGTDTPVIGYPGQSAQNEVAELVAIGLTPYEALTVATKNAGDFVLRSVPGAQPFGVVAVGQRADLILLSANPLDNISNLKTLVGVMSNGRWWPMEKLTQMREALAKKYQPIKPRVAQLNAFLDQAQTEQATKLFQSLRAAYPKENLMSQAILHVKVASALQEKKYHHALAIAKINAELHPGHFAVYHQLGLAYLGIEDRGSAKKYLQQSLSLCPYNGAVLEVLGQVETKQPE